MGRASLIPARLLRGVHLLSADHLARMSFRSTFPTALSFETPAAGGRRRLDGRADPRCVPGAVIVPPASGHSTSDTVRLLGAETDERRQRLQETKRLRLDSASRVSGDSQRSDIGETQARFGPLESAETWPSSVSIVGRNINCRNENGLFSGHSLDDTR